MGFFSTHTFTLRLRSLKSAPTRSLRPLNPEPRRLLHLPAVQWVFLGCPGTPETPSPPLESHAAAAEDGVGDRRPREAEGDHSPLPQKPSLTQTTSSASSVPSKIIFTFSLYFINTNGCLFNLCRSQSHLFRFISSGFIVRSHWRRLSSPPAVLFTPWVRARL
ncbi:unnamed protein product [Camellia sinensis]